jgi:two-component sensor histidine kinase
MIPAPAAQQRSNQAQAGSRKCKGTELVDAVVLGQAHLLDPQYDAQLLLREFTHRINNEFTSAISVIAIAAARSKSRHVKQIFSEVQDKIQAYAEVHHALQMAEHVTLVDVAAYLKQLCRAISRSKLDIRGIQLLFVERPFLMRCDRCWRLGLIVSELITNSMRHAFSEDGGAIRVELVPVASDIECHVADNGKSEKCVGPGRGQTIVDGLVGSLGGTITRRFGRWGSKSVVRIPLDPGSASMQYVGVR